MNGQFIKKSQANRLKFKKNKQFEKEYMFLLCSFITWK